VGSGYSFGAGLLVEECLGITVRKNLLVTGCHTNVILTEWCLVPEEKIKMRRRTVFMRNRNSVEFL
jgi:hypothetical protein